MPSSLLDSLMSLAGPQVMGALASRLGEPEGKVNDGLKSAAASILASVAGRSTDTGFISQIFSMITGAGASGILGNLAGLASGGPTGAVAELGQKFLGTVLGGQQSAITSAIASASGLKNSSAQGLLGMAAPMILGMLGQKVSSGGLNAASFASLLGGEASALKGLLPAGLGSLLPSMPSMPNVGAMASAAASKIPPVEAPSSTNWALPLILGALALAGAWFFLGREAPKVDLPDTGKMASDAAGAVKDAAKDAAAGATSMANSAWAALGEFFKRKLPNGIELNIPQMGVENKLIGFIEDAAKPVDKTTWFDFDRLLFDTGKATLKPESQEQLKNVTEILKAFPNVHIKVGGYTDNVGDKAANQALSAARAASVAGELVALGIDKARVESEGYGDQHPVADNTTEEGRAKNRRVSMRVTKK